MSRLRVARMLSRDSRPLLRRIRVVGGFYRKGSRGRDECGGEVWIYFQPCVTRLEVRREAAKEGPGWTASIDILVVQHEAKLHRAHESYA
jgi:hypothetical protein